MDDREELLDALGVTPVVLGLKPFLLVEYEGPAEDDEDGTPRVQLRVRFGGGMDADILRDILPELLASLPEED